MTTLTQRAGVVVSTLALTAMGALAVTWPADDSWLPLTVGGSLYVDAITAPGYPAVDHYNTPPNPDWQDIVGGLDSVAAGPFAAGFWYRDDDHIMFRMRVDNEPNKNAQVVWQALLNTDADNDVDWSVQLDLSGDDEVELVPAISGGPDSCWDVVLAADPQYGAGSPATDFYRFVNATAAGGGAPYGGSHFQNTNPNDDDYFIDFAYPRAAFEAMTGVPGDFDFSDHTALSTSTTHTLDNKDLPDFCTWADPTPLPEPLTLTAVLLGACGLGRYARRRVF